MLHIYNETSPLTDLCVCLGSAVPQFDSYRNDPEQLQNFKMLPWDKTKLLEQQQKFFEVMGRYGVKLHFVNHSDVHPWQMYTRDTGFVIHNKFYFSRNRELTERVGEIELLRQSIPTLLDQDMIEIIQGKIEGGDVLIDEDTVYIGISDRTTLDAVTELAQYVKVTPIYLGTSVMHLDTRMTILPGRQLLIYPSAFLKADLNILKTRFTLIEVTEAEALMMGTNVFVINPTTVILHSSFIRIARLIESVGIKVEQIDYSEPNALLGSFRCATLPLARL